LFYIIAGNARNKINFGKNAMKKSIEYFPRREIYALVSLVAKGRKIKLNKINYGIYCACFFIQISGMALPDRIPDELKLFIA